MLNHVHQLRALRLPRQRGQVRLGNIREGQTHNTEGRGQGGSQPRHSEGWSPFPSLSPLPSHPDPHPSQSETAGLQIPEIDLVLTHGTLGGRFTTIEGILDQVYEELSERLFHDSGDPQARQKFETFLKNLKAVKNAEKPFTLILDDPLANSYLQNLYAPDPDPNMVIENYERSWEQNEELGLNDMKVEGYQEEEGKAKEEGEKNDEKKETAAEEVKTSA